MGDEGARPGGSARPRINKRGGRRLNLGVQRGRSSTSSEVSVQEETFASWLLFSEFDGPSGLGLFTTKIVIILFLPNGIHICPKIFSPLLDRIKRINGLALAKGGDKGD